MNVTVGHFHLTPGQKRFRDLLAAYPTLMPYWNFDTSECCVEELESAILSLTRSEQIMAAFFRGVWFGTDDRRFPLIGTAMVLDEDDVAVITGWLRDPFFP